MITRKFSSFKTKEVALQIVSALCWFGLLKNATSDSQRFLATISTVTVIDLRKCWSIAIHGFVHLTSIWSWSWRRNNILFYFSSKYIMNYITSFSFQKETCLCKQLWILSLNTSVSTRHLLGNLLEYVTTAVLEDLSCHCQPYTQRNSYSPFLNIVISLYLRISIGEIYSVSNCC